MPLDRPKLEGKKVCFGRHEPIETYESECLNDMCGVPCTVAKPHLQLVFAFANGYGASVIKGCYSYGSKIDRWELGFSKWHEDKKSWDLVDFGGDQVKGYLTDEDVAKWLDFIEEHGLGEFETPSTAPGEAEPTIASHMIKGMKK